jgi:probable FeS assembly SUF system protein SufT
LVFLVGVGLLGHCILRGSPPRASMRGLDEVKRSSTMHSRDPIPLKRAVTATLIPYGGSISLPAGATVTITQALGGSYTVLTELGQMARIEGKDADAIGVEKAIRDQLKTCYDPEIPVNIVELGLVYQNEITELPDGGFKAAIKFTLTAPGCGMGPVLQKEVETKVAAVPGVKESKVEVVFEPAWDKAMMSEAAKLKLGIF